MMRKRWSAGPLILALGLISSPAMSAAQPFADEAQAEREAARRERQRGREDREYESGQRLLERSQWQQAAERFAAVA